MISIKEQQLSKTLIPFTLYDLAVAIKQGKIVWDLTDGTKFTQNVAATINTVRATSDKAERTKIKSRLPMFYLCEYKANDAGANLDNMQSHTGHFMYDIDGISREQAEALRQSLLMSPFGKYVSLLFISPSNGLKFMLHTSFSGTDDAYYTYCYKKLQLALEKLLDVKLDTSTCNINRGTYFSYDQQVVFRQSPALLSVERFKEGYEASKPKTPVFNWTIDEVDVTKAKLSMDKKFNEILATMFNGNRHSKYHAICCAAFVRGLGVEGATDYLMQCKALGQYTETNSPDARARDSYNSWLRAGGQVMSCFLNKQASKKHVALSIAAILSS